MSEGVGKKKRTDSRFRLMANSASLSFLLVDYPKSFGLETFHQGNRGLDNWVSHWISTHAVNSGNALFNHEKGDCRLGFLDLFYSLPVLYRSTVVY